MNNITRALYIDGKNNETKCSLVKSVLCQRQFKKPCLQAAPGRVCVCVRVNNDRTIEPFPYIQLNHQIESKSQDYGDVSARNTTRAPNNMQPEITAEKSKKPKRLGKEECFELASESVNGAQVSMLPNGMCVF